MNDRLARCLRGIDALAGFTVSLALFVVMVLTTADVVSRYFLSRPIAAALELTEALMAVIIFAALPLVSARGTHITVDLLEMAMGERVSLYLDAVVQFVCALAIGVVAWRVFVRAAQLHGYGETSAVLMYPVWPTAAIVALGSMVSVLVFIGRGTLALRKARRQTDPQQGKGG